MAPRYDSAIADHYLGTVHGAPNKKNMSLQRKLVPGRFATSLWL
jgi:hypothetical protein